MSTLELTEYEVRKYKGACERDDISDRSLTTCISREAYYTCQDILCDRRLIGEPVEVTVTLIYAPGPNLYELHYSAP